MLKDDIGEFSAGSTNPKLLLEFISSIEEVTADEWNALVPENYPFLRYEFLSALESTRCVSPQVGWVPKHIVIRNPTAKTGLLAAAPMYLKFTSQGEFIFDWRWQELCDSLNVQYYPKLVLQTPFTPLRGPKILIESNSNSSQLRDAIINASRQIVNELNLSSIHWLFITDEERLSLLSSDYTVRGGAYQFIWRNNNYTNMDDFLNMLSSRKRKKIRRERRGVAEQGISIEVIEGEHLSKKHWQVFAKFYRNTTYKYLAYQYLSVEFFKLIGETMPENIVLFLARKDEKYIGASFCLRSSSSLYGRYWGCDGDYPFLHFESCYYSAIEYCINKGLSMYDAGTRGGHKLDRGFMAEMRYAGHFVRHPEVARILQAASIQETSYYRRHCEELNANSAYRQE